MDAEYTGVIARPYNSKGTYQERSRGDKRGLDYVGGSLVPFNLPLDNAQALKEFAFAGDCIYLDRLSTGSIRFAFDMAWPVRFPLGPNDKVTGVPFRQLLLEWDSQPGKIARLWTGYGVEVTPALGAISTLDSITNPVGVQGPRAMSGAVVAADLPVLARDLGIIYASAFASAAGLGAASNEQVWAPASNPNGAMIWRASGFSQIGAATNASLLLLIARATAAPGSNTDGDVLNVMGSNTQTLAGEIGRNTVIDKPIYVAAGKGLWWRQGANAEGGFPMRQVLYTLF